MNEYRKWKWYEILAFLPHISCWCAKVYACQCCVCLPRNHSETPIKHQNVLHSLLINNSLSFFQYHSSPCENWPLPPIPQKKKTTNIEGQDFIDLPSIDVYISLYFYVLCLWKWLYSLLQQFLYFVLYYISFLQFHLFFKAFMSYFYTWFCIKMPMADV